MVASKRRKHIVQSANFDGPVPAWAQQMMDSVQHVLRRQDRAENRSRLRASDPILSIPRLVDGKKPNVSPLRLWFPADQAALVNANEDRMNALLNFYSLGDEGCDMTKKLRLMAHLGVIPL